MREGADEGLQDPERVAEAGPAQLHRAVEVPRANRLAHRAGLVDVLHQRHPGDPVLAQADEARDVVRAVAEDLFDRRVAEERPHRPVEGARPAAPLDVAEDGRPRLGAEPLLEEPPDPLRLDRLPVPVDGPLGEDDRRVPTARPAPFGEDGAHLLLPVVPLRGRLGYEDPARPRREGAHQRQVAAVPPHHLDDEGPLVARRRRHEGVDRLHDPVERRVGPDRHVGPGHVVVDRPDEADEGERRGRLRHLGRDLALRRELLQEAGPLAPEEVGARQGAVAADDDERVDPLARHVPGGREASLARAERRAAGRADDGAPLREDPADVVPTHPADPLPAVDEPLEPLLDGEDVEPLLEGRPDGGSHDGVHPGRVAAAREDRHPPGSLARHESLLGPGRGTRTEGF